MTDSNDGNGPKSSYDVGYGKPPHSTRFGEIHGNPRHPGGSRKRKPPSLHAAFEKALSLKIKMKEGGVERRTDPLTAAMTRVTMDALAGKPPAMAMFLQLCRERQSQDISVDTIGPTDDLAIIEAYLKSLSGDDDVDSPPRR